MRKSSNLITVVTLPESQLETLIKALDVYIDGEDSLENRMKAHKARASLEDALLNTKVFDIFGGSCYGH